MAGIRRNIGYIRIRSESLRARRMPNREIDLSIQIRRFPRQLNPGEKPLGFVTRLTATSRGNEMSEFQRQRSQAFRIATLLQWNYGTLMKLARVW